MYQNRSTNTGEKKQYPHWINSPFTMELDVVKVEVKEDGTVVLTEDHGDEGYDEIKTTVKLFNRVLRMLHMTRRMVMKDTPYIRKDQD